MTIDKVKKVIAEHLEIEESEITEKTTFEDLSVDSLDTVEILMELEDEFGIEIDAANAGTSVGSLTEYIDGHKE